MTVRLRRGCRIYQCEFEYLGERESFSTGETTKAAALQKEKARRNELQAQHAADVMAQHAQAGAGVPHDAPLAGRGGYRATKVWKDYWITKGYDTENHAGLKGTMDRMLRLTGEKTDLSQLDDHFMLTLKAKLKEEGPAANSRKPDEFAPSSINDYLRLVFRMWNHARDYMHMTPRYVLHRGKWLDPEAQNTIEMGFFEEWRLETVCRERRPELIPVYECGINTMVRRTALCKLEWSQVNWERRTITVKLKGRGKQKKDHTVPLNEKALKIIAAQKGNHPVYVFTLVLTTDQFIDGRLHKAGTRIPLKPSTFTELMREMFDAAGLPHLSAGHLRHTGATRMLRATGNLHIVQKFLGHTTTKCTLRYAELCTEDAENAANMTEAVVAQAREKVITGLSDPGDQDVRRGADLLAKVDEKARAAVKERLRQNAQAAAFAYAAA